MLKLLKYYGNNYGNRTHVETKDLANYNNWLFKKCRREVISPIDSGHWSLMEFNFILYIKNACVSFSSHSYNSCEVKRIIPLLKISCYYHKECSCEILPLGVPYKQTKNFKMSSMLVCSLRNSFDSFSVVQNGKNLHNTKLEQEKDSK